MSENATQKTEEQKKPAVKKAGLASTFNMASDWTFVGSTAMSMTLILAGMAPVAGFMFFSAAASTLLGTWNAGANAAKWAFVNKIKDGDSEEIKDIKAQFHKSAGFSAAMRTVSVAGYGVLGFTSLMVVALTLSPATAIPSVALMTSIFFGSMIVGPASGLLARRTENKMAAADAAIKALEAPKVS